MSYLGSAGGSPEQAQGFGVYLDHAATTPMLPDAIAVMTRELAQLGNQIGRAHV